MTPDDLESLMHDALSWDIERDTEGFRLNLKLPTAIRAAYDLGLSRGLASRGPEPTEAEKLGALNAILAKRRIGRTEVSWQEAMEYWWTCDGIEAGIALGRRSGPLPRGPLTEVEETDIITSHFGMLGLTSDGVQKARKMLRTALARYSDPDAVRAAKYEALTELASFTWAQRDGFDKQVLSHAHARYAPPAAPPSVKLSNGKHVVFDGKVRYDGWTWDTVAGFVQRESPNDGYDLTDAELRDLLALAATVTRRADQ